LYGITIRGDGREEYVGAENELSILDRIIHRCVQNDPARRFQSVNDLRVFEKARRNPKRDVFEKIYEFDEVVRSSLPKIRDIYETSNPPEISRFLTNFIEQCDPNEFWWIDSDGGDNTLGQIKPISDGRWLFQEHFEVKIRNLICYRSPGIWQSFFILLLEPDEPFKLLDFDGNAIDHRVEAEWNTDYAVLFQEKYMPSEEFQNGHYEHKGKVFKTPPGEALVRYRYMKPNAFMVVPRGTGPDRIDREANTTFLQEAIANGVIDPAKLRKYLYAASNHASGEIINML
jgi:serine/threonine-protein kinase